jgi:hypothetical protein
LQDERRCLPFRRLVAIVNVLLLICCGGLQAQTSQGAKIRQDVGKIGLLGNITVYLPAGQEYYGSVARIGTDDFAVNDVDQRREVVLRYGEVKKVRSGYGTGRAINGKRIHPRTKLWVSLAVVGGLLRWYSLRWPATSLSGLQASHTRRRITESGNPLGDRD